jgi:hypothetical protein
MLAIAGCGGGSHGKAQTVGAYGGFAAATVASAPGGPVNCREDARILTHEAVLFLARYGSSAAYPADLYYMNMRESFADYEARGCAPHYLGDALASRFTLAQRRFLVANLPHAMADVFRAGLKR